MCDFHQFGQQKAISTVKSFFRLQKMQGLWFLFLSNRNPLISSEWKSCQPSALFCLIVFCHWVPELKKILWPLFVFLSSHFRHSFENKLPAALQLHPQDSRLGSQVASFSNISQANHIIESWKQWSARSGPDRTFSHLNSVDAFLVLPLETS